MTNVIQSVNKFPFWVYVLHNIPVNQRLENQRSTLFIHLESVWSELLSPPERVYLCVLYSFAYRYDLGSNEFVSPSCRLRGALLVVISAGVFVCLFVWVLALLSGGSLGGWVENPCNGKAAFPLTFSTTGSLNLHTLPQQKHFCIDIAFPSPRLSPSHCQPSYAFSLLLHLCDPFLLNLCSLSCRCTSERRLKPAVQHQAH